MASRLIPFCVFTPASKKTCWPLTDFAITSTRRVTPLKLPVDTTSIVPAVGFTW